MSGKDGLSGTYEESLPLNGGKQPGKTTNPRRQRPRSFRESCITFAAITASVLALLLGAQSVLFSVFGSSSTRRSAPNGTSTASSTNTRPPVDDSLEHYDELGRFVLEDYDAQPTFSDFLPALAGYYGKPLYAFYVNRGQGIASFGVEDKDHPILEFNSANKAYQSTALLGFRTFIQGRRKGQDNFVTEPFSALQTRFFDDDSSKQQPKRFMYVGSNEMQLQEIDHIHGIETNVTYFILPEEDFGAFVKRTTIRNLVKTTLHFSMLDGLARMEPAGGKLEKLLKSMGRTLEGWMGVYQPYPDTNLMPFYRLSTQPGDSASVTVQEAGHWCLSVLERGTETSELLPIVYETSKVFGEDTSLLNPIGLQQKSIGDILEEPQYGAAKTSSAFSAIDKATLRRGETLTVSTFFGKAGNILDVPVIARRLLQDGFGEYKVMRTRAIFKQITAGVETQTANKLFDGHVQQMFLDNSLRGGVPTILGEVDDNAKMKSYDEDPRLKVYHLFSRKHGDLERDYNDFEIASTFFSEGPGNFRDVAQNRRNDVLFNPRIGSFNVRTFLSFIQADGYNPLTVEAVVFTIRDLRLCEKIATQAVGQADGHRAQREALTGILHSGPFRPGQLFLLVEQQNIELIISRQDFIDSVAAAAEMFPMAVYDTGFWADHWTYYVDLIESYLAIYPDWEERLMFEVRLPYFFSPATVVPRESKYVVDLRFGGIGKHVRQLNATVDDEDAKAYQKRFISNTTGWYVFEANWQHDEEGQIYSSSPIAKLFVLATLKFATRDAYGMGIEYESGRPGWNDANNGLVGMLGSGMPETYELVKLLRYIRSVVQKYKRPIVVPVELLDLVETIDTALDVLAKETPRDEQEGGPLEAQVPQSLFTYWDTVATAREDYRERTNITFIGKSERLSPKVLLSCLDRWMDEIDRGIARANEFGTFGDGDNGMFGITPTYFSFNVTEWSETGNYNEDLHPLVRAKAMAVNLFPLFLEGPVRMMKTVEPETAREIYVKVKSSPLRDEGLGMYTISASLKGQSFDMGREMGFAPGWLENQSVWLHMSYKWYLELIRHDLFDEFYDEMTSGGMLPFFRSNYGRSRLECSSFLASSAMEDPSLRGRGFLARLSGSTAEFLSMWVLLFLGPQPFFVDVDTNELRLQLIPALPRWLFQTVGDDDKNELSKVTFKLFGSIDVTYYNARGRDDLFRIPPTRYVVGLRDGSTFTINGTSIGPELADKIRRVVFVASIDVYFE